VYLRKVYQGGYAGCIPPYIYYPGICWVYTSLYTTLVYLPGYTVLYTIVMTVLVSGACSDVRVSGKRPWAPT